MADACFEDPRLAGIYDVLEGERPDLDLYVSLASELGAGSVLDIGCGTGTLACLLAQHGLEVIAVDPAAASLAVARHKPYAERVQWVEGDASTVAPRPVDLATMTGNVAQVFLSDREWDDALLAVHGGLRPGGWLVFETRDPDATAWRGWTRDQTYRRVLLPDGGTLEAWTELVALDLPLVSFRQHFRFEADGALLVSDSTLRFRTRADIADSLEATGFAVTEVRDAPDRPGLELVVIAGRAGVA